MSGDTTKIVTSLALDNDKVLTAPVIIEHFGTVGAWTVVMPGVRVGEQTTLAPLSIPRVGAELKARTVYMGAPAIPVKVR